MPQGRMIVNPVTATLGCESYIEAAKELRVFRPIVEDPNKPRKRLRPDEIEFYGPVPKPCAADTTFTDINFLSFQPNHMEQEQQQGMNKKRKMNMNMNMKQEQQQKMYTAQEDKEYSELFAQLVDYPIYKNDQTEVQDGAAVSPTNRNEPQVKPTGNGQDHNGAGDHVEFGGVN